MKKKAFLKCLVALLLFGSNGVVAAWIPLSSLHIVLLRTLLGGLFLLGLFFLRGGRFTFHRKKKSFGFLALSGSAGFYFVFGRNHAATANYRCCLDDWQHNGVRACKKEKACLMEANRKSVPEKIPRRIFYGNNSLKLKMYRSHNNRICCSLCAEALSYTPQTCIRACNAPLTASGISSKTTQSSGETPSRAAVN